MALKPRIKALNDAPEAVREFYVEKDGEFVLSIDGVVEKEKLNEFRDKNIDLLKKVDDFERRFGNVDPDKYRELLDREQSQRDKKLIDAGKIDELVAERVAAMKGEFEKTTGTLQRERDTLTKQLEGLVIDNGIREAASKAGVRPTAIDDVLLRGRALFHLKEGRAAPIDEAKLFGKSGDPMDIGEWVGTLTEKAPHLFESSQGSGAKPTPGAPGNGRISRDDAAGFLGNIDKIAGGQVQVV